MNDIIEKLEEIVGAKYCLGGDQDRSGYETDVSGKYKSRTLAVVRPANTAEVSAILRLANETSTKVVPLSGNTGLAGGGFAGDDQSAIILSTDRMDRILEIDPDSRTARVEAGVILANLHQAAEQHGLIFPLMFGARGSCRIGGNLSTNAGGSNVVRYGNTRALCLGIEAVTSTGEVVDLMSELHKDNTGYDLKDLLIGAEGTLGIITAAVLKLFPKPKAYATAMVAVPSVSKALTLLHKIQAATGNGVEAFEYMPRNYVKVFHDMKPDAPAFFEEIPDVSLLIEVAATADKDAMPDADGSIPVQNTLTAILGELMEEGLVLDAVIAGSESQRAQMWHQREMAFEISYSKGEPVTADVALPLNKVEAFLDAAGARVAELAPNAEFVEVAHLGDGNVHYTFWVDPDGGVPASKDLENQLHEVIEDVVHDFRGSFSAEHGIGISKLGTMRRRKDPAALAVMRAVKAALDPKNILNPGKTIP